MPASLIGPAVLVATFLVVGLLAGIAAILERQCPKMIGAIGGMVLVVVMAFSLLANLATMGKRPTDPNWECIGPPSESC